MATKKKRSNPKRTARKKTASKPDATAAKEFVIILDGSEHDDVSDGHVELEVESTIDNVKDLHERLRAALDNGGDVTVDTGSAKSVDTAALQLLCAFSRSAASREIDVAWQHQGSVFTDAARCLGLAAELGVD